MWKVQCIRIDTTCSYSTKISYLPLLIAVHWLQRMFQYCQFFLLILILRQAECNSSQGNAFLPSVKIVCIYCAQSLCIDAQSNNTLCSLPHTGIHGPPVRIDSYTLPDGLERVNGSEGERGCGWQPQQVPRRFQCQPFNTTGKHHST